MDTGELISYEPATGAELWRGQHGNVDEIVARSRRAWPAWAAQPLSTRMELVRRFANEVRKDAEKLATVIARETGKPLWEARTEVESVVNKVEISIRAYAERTAQRKLDNANALLSGLEELIDAQNDKILKAGGPQLKNPLRETVTPEDRQAYADAESTARQNRVGLWQDSQPVPPWSYRRAAKEQAQTPR